jgi:uncharacterized Fe-S cluster-containing radical SAM superfamily protein
MTENLVVIEGRRVFVCSTEGAFLGGAQAAVDLIGQARSSGAEMVAVPIERLDPEFFQLRTGMAGEFLQKFVTYQLPIAIVGDTSDYAAQSKALRDFIHESNEHDAIWFLASTDELWSRIKAAIRNS